MSDSWSRWDPKTYRTPSLQANIEVETIGRASPVQRHKDPDNDVPHPLWDKNQPPIGGRSRWDYAGIEEDARKASGDKPATTSTPVSNQASPSKETRTYEPDSSILIVKHVDMNPDEDWANEEEGDELPALDDWIVPAETASSAKSNDQLEPTVQKQDDSIADYHAKAEELSKVVSQLSLDSHSPASNQADSVTASQPQQESRDKTAINTAPKPAPSHSSASQPSAAAAAAPSQPAKPPTPRKPQIQSKWAKAPPTNAKPRPPRANVVSARPMSPPQRPGSARSSFEGESRPVPPSLAPSTAPHVERPVPPSLAPSTAPHVERAVVRDEPAAQDDADSWGWDSPSKLSGAATTEKAMPRQQAQPNGKTSRPPELPSTEQPSTRSEKARPKIAIDAFQRMSGLQRPRGGQTTRGT